MQLWWAWHSVLPKCNRPIEVVLITTEEDSSLPTLRGGLGCFMGYYQAAPGAA